MIHPDTRSFQDIFRRLSRPLEPIPTHETPRLQQIFGIRAVLFDIYGTLFVSGTGDVGTLQSTTGQAKAMDAALRSVDVGILGPPDRIVARFFREIESSHEALRADGVEFPEVDVVDIWEKTISHTKREGLLDRKIADSETLQRLAIEYESRVNPVWPMPGVKACLRQLIDRGFPLGLVSNAQFYTPILFSALLEQSVEQCGFSADLQFYSYQSKRAKPGPDLFRSAAEALSAKGIDPPEAIYVGNDMLNDILAAREIGFRTALFAGDRRSLRLRSDHPRVVGIEPDIRLTALDQLPSCLTLDNLFRGSCRS